MQTIFYLKQVFLDSKPVILIQFRRFSKQFKKSEVTQLLRNTIVYQLMVRLLKSLIYVLMKSYQFLLLHNSYIQIVLIVVQFISNQTPQNFFIISIILWRIIRASPAFVRFCAYLFWQRKDGLLFFYIHQQYNCNLC